METDMIKEKIELEKEKNDLEKVAGLIFGNQLYIFIDFSYSENKY